jgi:hypothetical protein
MYAYLVQTSVQENMDSVPIDIGNFFSYYYCNLINAVIEQHDFILEKMEGVREHGPSNEFYGNPNLPFFSHLKDVPYSVLQPYHDQFVAAGIVEKQTCYYSYHCYDDNPVKYRANRILKPLIHSLIDDALKRSGVDSGILVDHPVIHFRCSDVPFLRSTEYKLQRYTYFSDCLDQIRKKTGRTFSQITILWYGGHHASSDDSQACSSYATKLQEYLTGLGYQVGIQSHSNVEDFAVLFYAPAVISTGGSYSMFAGYFGSGLFFQPQMFPVPVGETADWLVGGYNIEHDDVADYHNVESVVPLLRSDK